MKDINIEDLTFAYSNKIEVLHHISLVVESGESVGLIGANGAGKSTLLKLLVGLAEGYQGSIALGGLRVEKKIWPGYGQKPDMCFRIRKASCFYPPSMRMLLLAPEITDLQRKR